MESPAQPLEGKRALVTGAANGIGKAIATRLARSGAAVVLADRDEAALRAAAREIPGATAVLVELSEPESIERMFAHPSLNDAALDILVNSAGIAKRTLMSATPFALWNSILDINLTACFLCMQHGAARMTGQGGRIVSISSHSALLGSIGRGPYAASKGGLCAMTRVLATELGPRGITVNTVAPGAIETSMTRNHTPAQRTAWLERLPMRRYGSADEVAAAVCFLCSPEAGYITGQMLCVDGGYSSAGLMDSPETTPIA